MDAQPLEDMSALMRAINEQANQITALEHLLTTKLEEINQRLCDSNRQITDLTNRLSSGYSRGYSGEETFHRQEQVGGPVQIADMKDQYYGRDKDNPPSVPVGTLLTCVRCSYQWTTRTIRPKKCPECETPWWFPPKWRWHQTQTQSQ